MCIRDSKKAVSFENRIDHLKFAPAFNAMFRKHVSEDNTTFIIERPDDNESLTMETAVGIIERRRGDEPPQYTRYYPTGGGMEMCIRDRSRRATSSRSCLTSGRTAPSRASSVRLSRSAASRHCLLYTSRCV